MLNFREEIEASRKSLLGVIEGSADITFIRGYGNIGDHLIYAGTRQLLSNTSYTEASILRLEGVTGHTALVSGSGSWCGPYHDLPQFLPLIEERFERVIILPSSFDVSEESVRQALTDTRAFVFARELESYEQIRGLCNAAIAYDCAFFFDFSPYRYAGEGVLTAYRTDKESISDRLPPGNNDISVTCETLDEWLWAIARHEVIRTDRAHVMIAGALLGKRVECHPSTYHKLPAIADYSLKGYPIFVETNGQDCNAGNYLRPPAAPPFSLRNKPDAETRVDDAAARRVKEGLIEKARDNLRLIPEKFLAECLEVEVTIVMLSHGRVDQTVRAIEALSENVSIPFKLLVIDNGSGYEVRQKLTDLSARHDSLELIFLDENLGCAGGRNYSLDHVKTRYITFLDNDVEVLPGAIEHLLYSLETNPDVVASAGNIVFPDGVTQVCGGDYRIEGDVFFHELLAAGKRYDDPAAGASGKCTWVSGTLLMIRKDFFINHTFDLGMRNYYEDLEWCYRLNQGYEGAFYRNVNALAVHYHLPKLPARALPVNERRRRSVKYIESIGCFYKLHGKIIQDIFYFMPELWPPTNPANVLSARIALDLINAYGSDWFLAKWTGGDLLPLFRERDLEEKDATARAREKSIANLSRRVAKDVDLIAGLEESLAQRTGLLTTLNGSILGGLLRRYGRFKYRHLLPLYRMFGLMPAQNRPKKD